MHNARIIKIDAAKEITRQFDLQIAISLLASPDQ